MPRHSTQQEQVRRRILCLATVSLVAFAVAGTALATPSKISQQGRLVDDAGDGLEGAHQLEFSLYEVSSGGEAVWSESRSLDLDNGYYATVLGDQSPLGDELFAGGTLWLELRVDDVTLEPRQQVVSVPTAMRAAVAESVDGGVVDASEVWVGGELVIDDQGYWVGANGANSWNDLSDIPADIADGDGDTLGGISCIDGGVPSWNGAQAQWVCAQDSDTLGNMSCANGQVAKWDSTTATWVCNLDTDTLGSLGCFDGGIPAWNSSLNQWVCASDQDTDSDTLAGLSCANGGIPVWDALLAQWLCALSADTVLSESEVEAYVINGPLDLDAATTIGGEAPALLSDLTTALDWTAINNIPTDIADGDDILTEAQVEGFITNAPIDLPAGTTVSGQVIGAGANLGTNVTIGAVVPGDNYTSLDTPLALPDANAVGVSSLRFVSGGTTINNFSVDINITHTEMGDLKITLFAPSGSSVVLYDGELAGTANMVGNISRDFAITGGTIYALYNEPSNGTWRLEVIDDTATNTGTLNSWGLNINETWSGDLFVGNSITSDGNITTTGNIEVIQGSDLVFKNVAGTETLRIAGETGLITGAASGCPSDMRTGSTFCIELNERSSRNWYGANDGCFDAGRRLCTTSEWMMACRKISGLNSMTGNWEWTADATYSDETSIRMHDCGDSHDAGWGGSYVYRCCTDL